MIAGKMFYFESGTSTLKDIFADTNNEIPIANPVVLDGAGRLPNVFFTGSVKQILTDKDEVQIFERDPVGSSDLEGSFEDWSAAKVYDEFDLVTGPDGLYYQSIISNNQGNTPASFPDDWMRVSFVTQYNAAFSYSIGDIAIENNVQYISITNDNLNNTPSTDGSVNWIDTSGALKFISTQVASSSATVEFTTGIDSTFSKYVIIITSAFNSAVADLQIRTSSDGGSTFDSGASDYAWSKNTEAAATSSFLGDATDSLINAGSAYTINAGDAINGTIEIYNPSDSSSGTNIKFDLLAGSAATPINENVYGSGFRSELAAVNAIQFSLSAGVFTSGTFKLYGVV